MSYYTTSSTSAQSWCNGKCCSTNFPWTLKMLPSSFAVYNSRNNLLWTCPVMNVGLFTGAYLRIENTGDLILYDGKGNLQWYQGEKYLSAGKYFAQLANFKLLINRIAFL
jgi:hypothetical protein